MNLHDFLLTYLKKHSIKKERRLLLLFQLCLLTFKVSWFKSRLINRRRSRTCRKRRGTKGRARRSVCSDPEETRRNRRECSGGICMTAPTIAAHKSGKFTQKVYTSLTADFQCLKFSIYTESIYDCWFKKRIKNLENGCAYDLKVEKYILCLGWIVLCYYKLYTHFSMCNHEFRF